MQTITLNQVLNNPEIKEFDSDEENKLKLFCYNTCNNESDDFVKSCRGVVFNNETLVLRGLPYTNEYSHLSNSKVFHEKFDNCFGSFRFYPSYEGTLLRVFHFNNEWYLSTHHKLNAFMSKWSSRESFGTLFKRGLEHEMKRNSEFLSTTNTEGNTLDRFFSTLDKEKQYMFLLRTNEDNRIVCNPPFQDESHLLHVGTFTKGFQSCEYNTGLPTPQELKFENFDELWAYVDDIDTERFQGVICFNATTGETLKVLNDQYMTLASVRGNEPSIRFRYLQLRSDERMVATLESLYPKFIPLFQEYETILMEVARKIYDAYVSRFIQKEFTKVPRDEYQVILECHRWHLLNRRTNRVTLNKVVYFLNQQSPVSLNHMIKRLKYDRNSYQTGQSERQSERHEDRSAQSERPPRRVEYRPRTENHRNDYSEPVELQLR